MKHRRHHHFPESCVGDCAGQSTGRGDLHEEYISRKRFVHHQPISMPGHSKPRWFPGPADQHTYAGNTMGERVDCDPHLVAPSSHLHHRTRKIAPSSASITAQTRFSLAGETASPILPSIPFRQTWIACYLGPGISTINRFEDTASFTSANERIRFTLSFPEGHVYYARIIWI